MFKKILIANRGEIAVRVIRTARRLGICTVAVYSEADQSAPHTRMADEAVCIGPAPAAASYLHLDNIIQAVKKTGAEAVHPGYGFLSENADFSKALAKENVTFIGPTIETLQIMGSKSAAKDLMEKAGLSLLPDYRGEDQSVKKFKQEAARIGYPVLLKASAGGGGKGMRLVETEDEVADALASARREAISAFGNDRFLVEKFLSRPRHLEVQIFGDGRGEVVHMFDRDCSIQRRHQKIVEEAPAPALPVDVRTKLLEAGVTAGKAVDYLGAGTVEFLYDSAGGLYFMEMNTRLQVEHPVSEEITGIDFVEWQLRIAAGEGLPLTQAQITESGHALEVRVYAEDPDNNFAPSTGELTLLQLSAEVRNDVGIEEGQLITAYYDPMISKVITHAPARTAAVENMRAALDVTRIAGFKTNIRLLRNICGEPDFIQGKVSTRFIEDKQATLLTQPSFEAAPMVAAALWHFRVHRISASNMGLAGWRMNQPAVQTLWFSHELDVARLTLTINQTNSLQAVLETNVSASARKSAQKRQAVARLYDVSIIELSGGRVNFLCEGKSYDAFVAPNHPGSLRVWVDAKDANYVDLVFADIVSAKSTHTAAAGSLTALMPGVVTRLDCAPGDQVTAGDTLLLMEAMKMEHAVKAPKDGIIDQVMCKVGQQIKEGALLVKFQEHQS